MARKLRVEYPGAIYHVMNRGDRREPIFVDDCDRLCFVETFAEACVKTQWQAHTLCLMPNHFHLVIETPLPNLTVGMKWLLGTYTSRFNGRHKLSGHLFGGRYKSPIVQGNGGYLRRVCEYVHLNPVRARLLRPDQPLREYRWSSFVEFLKPPSQRPPWLRVDRVLGEMGIPRDSAAGRRQFERALEQRRQLDPSGQSQDLPHSWYLGDEEFRQELLGQMDHRMGPHHGGVERQEIAEARAERIVAEELRKREWGDADLALRRKGDPHKVQIARRLRRETTMTLNWIAKRLKMGRGGYLAHCLRQ